MSSHRLDGRGTPVSRRPAPRRAFRPQVPALETRELLSVAAAPSNEEQYMLQLINRARANPPAEAQRLLLEAAQDPTIRDAAAGWDLSGFSTRLAGTPARPPLAFDTRLIAAARDHNQVMLATNDQQHSPAGWLTDSRIGRPGDGQAYYPVANSYWATGENIFAYSRNLPAGSSLKDYVDYLHAGFLIDWANPDFSHLNNLMAPGPSQTTGTGLRPYSKIGIGLLNDADPTTPPPTDPENRANVGLNVGPVLVSQEFGWRSTDRADLTGAVYRDADADNFYTPGEGLGGVTIQAVGRGGEGTFQVQTWGSGGYSLPLPPGTYTVTATGGGLAAPHATVVSVGIDNVGWDVAETATLTLADVPVPGDYDGDGKTDLAVYRPTTSEWFILQSSAGPRSFGFGAPGDVPVSGDFDGDGRTDFAVFRPSSAEWFILQSSAGPRQEHFGAANLDIPAPGDYDGDGRTDLAVYRPTTGRWFILQSSAGPRTSDLGAPGIDVPIQADYDGDGRTDAAVYRPTTSEWFIQQSSAGPRSLRFGGAQIDVPVPGDYDGDGRADMAVYRPGTGEWFVLQSSRGPRKGLFGGPGVDRPVIGDYDGDGRTDPALFRPNTAQWFLLQSRREPRAQAFGQAGEPPSPVLPLVPTVTGLGLSSGRSSGSSSAVQVPTQSVPYVVAKSVRTKKLAFKRRRHA